MEDVQFDYTDDQEVQVSPQWINYQKYAKPYRFINELNMKKVNEMETSTIASRNAYKRQSFFLESTKNSSRNEQTSANLFPQDSGQFQTFDGKAIGGSCPVKRVSLRKKISIQKKRSSAYPLNGDGFTKLDDGQVIFGNWKNGVIHGNARIMYPTADIYIGEVKEYKRHGKGALILKNGEKYVGNFCNGKCEGYGTKYDRYGQVRGEGIWRNGVLVKRFE